MTTDLETPLTPEELAAGDGYEPAVTDVDCTPRPRFGESLRKFRARTAVTTVFDDDGEAHTRPVPDPHAVEDARWNRYVIAVCREEFDAVAIEGSPLVRLDRGVITIDWPAHVSDNVAAVIVDPDHALILAFQLDEACAELGRRRLGR